jgi:hypothetical protein
MFWQSGGLRGLPDRSGRRPDTPTNASAPADPTGVPATQGEPDDEVHELLDGGAPPLPPPTPEHTPAATRGARAHRDRKGLGSGHLISYLVLFTGLRGEPRRRLRPGRPGDADEPDLAAICRILAQFSRRHLEPLDQAQQRYAERVDPPERLHTAALPGPRPGPLGLPRDLRDLHALGSLTDLTRIIVGQAARALLDEHLIAAVEAGQRDTTRQPHWLLSRAKQTAPQTLVTAA